MLGVAQIDHGASLKSLEKKTILFAQAAGWGVWCSIVTLSACAHTVIDPMNLEVGLN
jgi:hypothetical protein